MRVLIANDDGMDAAGIRYLVKRIGEVATVYVAAPDTQKSASSQSISLITNVSCKEVPMEGAEIAFRVGGTPADCVKMGLQKLNERGIEVDIVISGINMGSNIGSDTHYSGTVGAATEAAIFGYHAIALSADDHKATEFEYITDLCIQMISIDISRYPTNIVLNINAPNLPKDEIKGVRLTRLAGRGYLDKFEQVDGTEEYKYVGVPMDYSEFGDDIDAAALRRGYVTVTPLNIDSTSYEVLDDLASSGIIKEV